MLTSKLLSLPTASSLHTTLRTDEARPSIVHGDGAFVKRLLLSVSKLFKNVPFFSSIEMSPRRGLNCLALGALERSRQA
jgi:hypothetical protein